MSLELLKYHLSGDPTQSGLVPTSPHIALIRGQLGLHGSGHCLKIEPPPSEWENHRKPFKPLPAAILPPGSREEKRGCSWINRPFAWGVGRRERPCLGRSGTYASVSCGRRVRPGGWGARIKSQSFEPRARTGVSKIPHMAGKALRPR